MNDARCPCCGSAPTQFVHPLSCDGAQMAFRDQRCSNLACEMPCRLWERIAWLLSSKKPKLNYEELESRLARVTYALYKYGEHTPGCKISLCTCGLRDVIDGEGNLV